MAIVEQENITGMRILPLVLSFLIFTMLFYVISDLYKKRRILSFSKTLQVFRFYPILGNKHKLIGGNFFPLLQKYLKKYSLPCTLWIGHECYYMTTDVEEIKVILNHPNAYEKSQAYANFHLLFGNSILLKKYSEWKIDRKLLQKAFNQRLLKGFVETFYKKSCELVEAIGGHRTKDKRQIFYQYSLGSFCANGTGLVNQIDDFDLTEILKRLLVPVGNRVVSAEILPEFIWKYTQEGRAFFKDSEDMRVFISNIIRKKRQHLSIDKELQEDSSNPYFMDLMLENEYKLYSEKDIIDQFRSFMLAATDTTGLTLAYTFTLLGMNPNAQEKVYEEVAYTIGLERPIYHSDLPNLKYTERAIFEAMRLLPSVPLIGRVAATDIDLSTRTLPAGINIAISIFNLHRSEKYWKDPLKYDPDRFLPEEVAKRSPYAFLPFSAGPRNCLGMKYAIMSAKTAVANIIRRYKIISNYKSVEDLKLESAITMQAVHDLDCEFIPRKC